MPETHNLPLCTENQQQSRKLHSEGPGVSLPLSPSMGNVHFRVRRAPSSVQPPIASSPIPVPLGLHDSSFHLSEAL